LLLALAAPRVLVKGVFFANDAELLLPSALRGRRSADEGVPFTDFCCCSRFGSLLFFMTMTGGDSEKRDTL
jgi:hypothetical protein